MPLRLKKILGALLVVVFMLFWVWLAVSLSGFVPKNKFAEMVFYIVASAWFAFHRYKYVRRGDQFTMPWPRPVGH